MSETEIILIAPSPRLLTKLLKRSDSRLHFFASISDFEAWRSGPAAASPLASSVDQLLTQLEIATDELPVELKLAMSWLRGQSAVPPLKALAEASCPQRSFFRLWSRTVSESPSQFLQHLRALHASALLQRGAALPEILTQAGCGSLTALQQLIDLPMSTKNPLGPEPQRVVKRPRRRTRS